MVCMSERIELKIGCLISEILELNGGAMGLCLGKFLRVRVKIDASKSLLKVINVAMGKEEASFTIFLSDE